MQLPPATRAPAGRRRFWATVAVFAVANLLAWGVFLKLRASPRLDVLRVDAFHPGDGAAVSVLTPLTWQFNLDVLPSPDGPPGSVTPAVPGAWLWKDRRTLSFVPADGGLPRASRVKFTLAPERLRTAEGFVLPAEATYTITTTPLRLHAVRQAGFEADGRHVLELEFNDRVLPADVAARLSIAGPDGKPLKFATHGEAAGEVVRIVTEPVEVADSNTHPMLDVTVREGLAGTSGPLGLEAPHRQAIPLGTVLAFHEISGSSPARGQASIRLTANARVDLDVARKALSVEPAVPFTVGKHSENEVMLHGDFVPGTRYAVKIASPAKGADKRRHPRGDTLSVLLPRRQAGVWFENAQGYLGSRGNRALLARAVGTPRLKLTAWRVYDDNLVRWRNAGYGYRWEGAVPEHAVPVAAKVIDVPGAAAGAAGAQRVQDVRIDLDELLPADARRDGVYRVTLEPAGTEASSGARRRGDDDDDAYGPSWRAATAVVTLSDIGLTAKQGDGKTITVWAVSLATARPMPGVRVRLFSDKNQLLGTGRTGPDGLATLERIDPARGERAAVILADVLPKPEEQTVEVAVPVAFPAALPATLPSTLPATLPAQLVKVRVPSREPALLTPTALTWLDLTSNTWDLADVDTSGRPYLRAGHEAFVYADRGVYRPGETVHLHAIVRGPGQKVPRPFPVRIQVRRPDHRDWRGFDALLDDNGGASLQLQLPDDLPTGRWTAHVGLAGDDAPFGSLAFQVEEYVPQRLKVAAGFEGVPAGAVSGAADLRLPVRDEPLTTFVQGDYLFGRPAAGLPASLHVRLDPVAFCPPKYAGWTFGDDARTVGAPGDAAVGEVVAHAVGDKAAGGKAPSDRQGGSEEVRLNDSGRGAWTIDLKEALKLDEAGEPPAQRFRGPWRLSVAASVMEPGGRAVTAARDAMVDALPFYVGVRQDTAASAGPSGLAATFDVALVKPDGSPAADALTLDAALFREEWNSTVAYEDGRYHYRSHRKLETAGTPLRPLKVDGGRARFAVRAPQAGAFIIKLTDRARGSVTSLRFYASSGSAWEDNVSRENPERLEVKLLGMGGKEAAPRFRPGQAARVVVRSPFAGRLLLAVETDRVAWSKVVEMTGSAVEVPVEVTGDFRPNAYVTASVVRPIDPQAPWRTHRAFGAARLTLDPSDLKLAVELRAAAEALPRSSVDVRVRLTRPDGSPAANASVTLAAVDEGILQLTRFATPDPLGFFHGPRALGVRSGDLYAHLMPEVPKPDKASTVGGDGGGDEGGRHRSPVSARRVKPVVLATGTLRTDADGVATTSWRIPDFAGKLRVMAVAHEAAGFGSASADVLVRAPLVAQSSLPRFAAPGDRFSVPITLFNNATTDGQATVTVEVSGPLLLAGAGESKRTLPPVALKAGGQATVSVEMLAAQAAGVGRVRLVSVMGDTRAEEEVELPVRPAAPMITRGGFASARPGAPATLDVPADLMPGTGKLDVRVTPWPSLQLPEGLDYLERYPYGCAEQTISTTFPLIYLSDLGPAIAPGMFAKERVAEKVRAGIVRLIGMQAADGGVAMWSGARESWPWASIYAAHLVVEARRAGHAVPEDFARRLLDYARRQLENLSDGDDLELQAYACYVLALAERPERGAMSRLGEFAAVTGARALPQHAPARAQARLYLALAHLATGRQDLAMALIPQDLPQPRATRATAGHLGSPIRDRAMLVNTLLAVSPDHPALPQLVQQLADAGLRRDWRSTQDCAFAVMALGRYLRQFQDASAYTAVELAAGEATLARAGEGATLAWSPPAAPPPAVVPATLPATRPASRYVVTARGAADALAHISWIQSGVPLAPPADADHGLKVRRAYFDERGKRLADLAVRSGDLVIVELTLEAPAGQAHLVVEDLLPAGLEIENPRLAGNAASEGRTDSASNDFHVAKLDVRDDRLVLVGTMNRSGSATYRYHARAVAPGTFIVPPVRAECMYDLAVTSICGGGATLTVRPLTPQSNVAPPAIAGQDE